MAAFFVSMEDKLTILKTRLSVARANEKEARKRWKAVNQVLEFKREVTVNGETNSQKIKYPLAWSAYDHYLSELTSTPPQTVINAEGREDLVKKIFWKGILENVKRRVRLGDLKEQFVQSFVATGKAVYKVGRRVETQQKENVATDLEGKVIVKSKVEAITRNETFVEVIDPRRVYLSPETKYRGPVLGEECPYLIEEMIKTREYVESTYGVKLDEDELELIDPEVGVDDDREEGNRDRLPGENVDDMKRVRLYAYYGVWESKPNCEILFTSKRIVRKRELPYVWGNKKPYIVLFNFTEFFKPLARGCMDAVLDLDQEYNENMNRIRTYIRRMVNPKWAKIKGSQIDESALLDPDVGVIIDESQPNAFRPVTPPPLDASIFEKTTSVEQLFYLLTGITYGASALQKNKTATGQNMQQQGADVKMGRMVGKLERAQEELETMMLQLEQQYAPKEGTDVRIVGADVVEMIKNKKFLYNTQQQMYQQKVQMAMAQGLPFDEPPPVDEYEQFQLSEDGRAVYTTYTREDIQGQFELNIISQSSNRSNRAVQSQQVLNALQTSAADMSVNRPELWKRWFSLNEMDDVDNLVNQQSSVVMPSSTQLEQPLTRNKAPSEANLNGSVQANANRTV